MNVITSEIIYYPISQTTTLPEESREQFGLKLKIYREAVGFLIQDPNFKIDLESLEFETTKDAIAFLVEATRQLNPNIWPEVIRDIILRIHNFRLTDKETAHVQTTWFLNDLITNLYQKSLAVQMSVYPKSISTQFNFFDRLFKNYASTMKLRQNLINKGHAVTIGGINQSILPDWYKKYFIRSDLNNPNYL